MGYGTVALDFTLNGKVPASITTQIPNPLPFGTPSGLRILRRCTLHLSDPSQNYRLSQLSPAYDILALRPTTEKALQQACHTLECDLISLDCSVRHLFFFHIKTMKMALERGVRFEICYGPGILNLDGGVSRRNLISNAAQIVRATRGRGIIISSEAKRALACRSPADVVNLAVMWGLPQDRGTEAIGREARSVVVHAEMKRRSFRGVIDVVHGGQEPPRRPNIEKSGKGVESQSKRKAGTSTDDITLVESPTKPVSKRERARLAKRAKLEAANAQDPRRAESLIDTPVATENLPSESAINEDVV